MLEEEAFEFKMFSVAFIFPIKISVFPDDYIIK